ncbi:hypothetical protein [Methanotorris igneus]|uniref:Uncharacterized protein n=1 Tax=Methanotorris igneus (strain DSM 5666 / JCM 11834 / Kol 5) TaxID=880724 RepID=F6BAG4_METIK|nr:hypothetical protein [Methanotorris igneus]AEF96977.1 hypothetical protein Metig_1442 [Methanotorris igneus Kol 5]
MDKILKLFIKFLVLFIGFIILDFVVEYYLFDGLAVYLYVSAAMVFVVLMILVIIYTKITAIY